ncbi:MAG: site-specific DNA-methyltransferase [Actinobacteria bacterium]|nr:site-specific DNA-methyltransferase [Actinomycetota bacterium]
MVCAIEDAGFEIRDQLAWMYGSGFPKSLDVSKAIDAAAGAVREVVGERPVYGLGDGRSMGGHSEGATAKHCPIPATAAAAAWSGWGTALKPAQEPIVLARKPLIGTVAANVLAHGTGAINVDGCRVGDEDMSAQWDRSWNDNSGEMGQRYPQSGRVSGKTVPPGRWPANVIMDEVAAAMLDEQSGTSTSSDRVRKNGAFKSVAKGAETARESHGFADTGGASRFFYCAKASRSEREAGLDHLPIRSGGELTDREDGSDGLKSPRAGAAWKFAAGVGGGRRNHHPTVKPVELMRYLIRLITPPGGIVLDPFTGSGTTHVAAKLEGFDSVGCDLSPEYVEIANARVDAVRGEQPDDRSPLFHRWNAANGGGDRQ